MTIRKRTKKIENAKGTIRSRKSKDRKNNDQQKKGKQIEDIKAVIRKRKPKN